MKAVKMIMNVSLTLVPIVLIRYVLLRLWSKEAFRRAAFIPPLVGKEIAAFWIYQAASFLLVLYLFFLKVDTAFIGFYFGVAVYGLGVLLCSVSFINFAKPKANGINVSGLYRISRNPIYVAYFICFLGCAIVTDSWVLLILLAVFQISAHWVILSEERWCINQFGAEYLRYMQQVRRYV